jgi:predicted nucleotidyltransferase
MKGNYVFSESKNHVPKQTLRIYVRERKGIGNLVGKKAMRD